MFVFRPKEGGRSGGAAAALWWTAKYRGYKALEETLRVPV